MVLKGDLATQMGKKVLYIINDSKMVFAISIRRYLSCVSVGRFLYQAFISIDIPNRFTYSYQSIRTPECKTYFVVHFTIGSVMMLKHCTLTHSLRSQILSYQCQSEVFIKNDRKLKSSMLFQLVYVSSLIMSLNS